MAQDAQSILPVLPTPPNSTKSLADAEWLLRHAAETGIDVDPGIQEKILRARAVDPAKWDEKTESDLLLALTWLSKKLDPVSVYSLKASDKEEHSRHIRDRYIRISIGLAIAILLFSLLSFITNALSNEITAKINDSNTLAATLRTQLGTTNSLSQTNADLSKPPPDVALIDVVTELQKYASNIRDIDSRAKQLNWFIGGSETEYYLTRVGTNSATNHIVFQLPVGLPNLWDAEKGRTSLYQHVRAFAQSVVDDVSIYYGAVVTCLLPVLYALFGTCVRFLRNYEQQITSRTFLRSSFDSGHLLIAGMCGMVVGLFNFTVSQGASLPPLAIAFLVGYGVDMFFSFLEGLLQALLKGKDSS
jgi:hypothetical protein